MTSELAGLGVAEARDLLRAGGASARELAEACLSAMEAGRFLNAFIAETPERALADADASDARRAAGASRGALDGVPVAVKDLFCTEGVATTAASRILEGFVPPYESAVTASLRDAGCVLLGKTNMDEFAMGSSNETSRFGPVRNPWGRGDGPPLVPGGSIRQPAAFCGIVGMKPTYGRCSRRGIVAFASSLDQAGPMTRTTRDAAILLGAMAGFDPGDSTSADVPVPDYEAALGAGAEGLRIGIPEEYAVDGMDPGISALWERGRDWLRGAGAEPVDVRLPHTEYALPAYYIVAPAEASSNLARYDGVRYGLREAADTLDGMYARTRGAGFGAEVRRRVLIGTYVLSEGYFDAYYLKAQKARALIARDFARAFERCDLILTPTTPGAAFAMGEKSDDPIAMYLNDALTVPASLAGLPAISVPAGLSEDGLPLGLQLVGRAFDEETVLRGARALEEAAGFDALPPASAAA